MPDDSGHETNAEHEAGDRQAARVDQLLSSDPDELLDYLSAEQKDELLADVMISLYGWVAHRQLDHARYHATGTWHHEPIEVHHARMIRSIRESFESMAEGVLHG